MKGNDVFGLVVLLAGFILFMITLFGYYAGMKEWLGWGFLGSFAVMVVAFFFREIGTFFISVVGFYGMWKGFGWEWWQAMLVAFPMMGILVALMLGGGIASVIGGMRKGKVLS